MSVGPELHPLQRTPLSLKLLVVSYPAFAALTFLASVAAVNLSVDSILPKCTQNGRDDLKAELRYLQIVLAKRVAEMV